MSYATSLLKRSSGVIDMRMPNIHRGIRPGLADVQCHRLKFEPGDRILVRVNHKLDQDQQRKLRRTVQKWAGCEVEILIIDLTVMDIEIEKKGSYPDESIR